ncbi:CHASE2 domain-containing protein [bacterium]|nr:CHASE2 domain-containing protein [bacterium]
MIQLFFFTFVFYQIVISINWSYISYNYYDWLFRTFPATKVTKEIVIVEFDPQTMEKYKKIVPLSVHQRVFDTVLSQNPLKLVVLSDSSNYFFFHATKEEQAKFLKSYFKNQSFAVGVNTIFDKSAVEVIEIDYKFKDIPFEMWPIVNDTNSGGRDSRSRKIVIAYMNRALGPSRTADLIRGKEIDPTTLDGPDHSTFYQTTYWNNRYAKPGSFKVITYSDIIENRIEPSDFKEKIVLLGRFFPNYSTDSMLTPMASGFSSESKMSNLEIHANSVNTLLYSLGGSRIGFNAFKKLALLHCLRGVWVALFVSPRRGPIMLCAFALGSFGIATSIFVTKGLYIYLIPQEMALLISYFGLLPFRLAIESEKSKRNQLTVARQIGHDIKSPLSALKVLNQVMDKLPERQQSILDKATQRIEDITENLLNLDKQNPSSLNGKPTSLLESIQSLLEEKEWEFHQQSKVKIRFRPEDSTKKFTSLIDNTQFKRVLSNLINNAVESYNGSEGKVDLTLKRKGPFNEIAIVDQGCGIKKQDLSKVGQPGFTKGKKGNGHGLGTHSAKQFAMKVGGSLSFLSDENSGTTVLLRVPRV